MSFFVCPGFLRHRKQRASRAMACQLKFNCSVIYILRLDLLVVDCGFGKGAEL